MRKGKRSVYRGWYLVVDRKCNFLDFIVGEDDPSTWVYKYMCMDIPAYRSFRVKALMQTDANSKAFFTRKIFVPSRQFTKGCWE